MSGDIFVSCSLRDIILPCGLLDHAPSFIQNVAFLSLVAAMASSSMCNWHASSCGGRSRIEKCSCTIKAIVCDVVIMG